MKSIDTLVEDIERTIQGHNGWDETVGDFMAKSIASMAKSRFAKPQEPRGYLSLSALGSPCERKLWYKINKTKVGEQPDASLLLKFFYGDLIEELILALVSVSGHSVTGAQDRMYVGGIRGHRDAVIDGMTIDVKTTTDYGFKKFKSGGLREDDPFGYVSQLSSYVYAAKDDPLVTDKKRGAFLVVNKLSGEICLDMYDFSGELESKEDEVKHIKSMVASPTPPERPFEPVPASKTSENKKLHKTCGFCDFKQECFPGLRRFVYSNRFEYLTDVVKEPNVPEDLTFGKE